MAELHIIDHPLVQHKISLLRDKNTGTKEFRELVSEIAMFICYEATRDLPLKEIELETPLAVAKTRTSEAVSELNILKMLHKKQLMEL